MTTVILLGTLDTKGDEYRFVRDRLREDGVETVVVDAGVLGEPRLETGISREEVAKADGVDLGSLVEAGDRGAAIDTMLRGATAVVGKLIDRGDVHGIFGMGGSGGSTLVSGGDASAPGRVPEAARLDRRLR